MSYKTDRDEAAKYHLGHAKYEHAEESDLDGYGLYPSWNLKWWERIFLFFVPGHWVTDHPNAIEHGCALYIKHAFGRVYVMKERFVHGEARTEIGK